MKNSCPKIAFIFFFLPFYIFPALIFGGSGGPDAYGYSWKDSNEPGGPAYSWYDVIGNGKEQQILGLGDDNVIGPFTIINNFTYYWYTVDKFYIGSNGYLSFGSINIASPFPAIPNSTDGKNNFIAALLSDLNFTGTGNTAKCYYLDMGDTLIVSWINAPFWKQAAPTYTGSNSFQIILNKLDNSITINYQNQSGVTQNSDITVGIENINGDIGLQHSKNLYPPSGYSIKYTYPSNPGPITDVGARWNTAEGSRGIFIPVSSNPFSLITNVGNLGNQKIPTFAASSTVNDYFGASWVSSSTNTADSLGGGKDTTIVFPDPFDVSTPGIYIYTTSVSGIINDATSSNNSVTQELVVVDTSQLTTNLSYTDSVFEAGLGWQGGGGGAAMYFVPPYYPAKITGLNYIITINTGNKHFWAKIFDDDGLNGTAGTLLYEDSVPASLMNVGGFTNVPLLVPVTIASGGFYVLWDMGGDSINIGTDLTPPFSLRSYEVLGGTWAEYRNNESADFGISVDFEKGIIEDVATTEILSPSSGAVLSTPTVVKCRIKNFGNISDGSFIANYSFNGGPVVTENYLGGPIPPGDSVDFTFASPFFDINPVAGNLCAWTVNTNDFNLNNDTSCIPVQFGTISTVGINESLNDLRIFPNPGSGKFFIELSGPGFSEFRIKLFNLMGEVVNEFYLKQGQPEFNLDLPEGIYFLELFSEGKMVKKKIVIGKQD